MRLLCVRACMRAGYSFESTLILNGELTQFNAAIMSLRSSKHLHCTVWLFGVGSSQMHEQTNELIKNRLCCAIFRVSPLSLPSTLLLFGQHLLSFSGITIDSPKHNRNCAQNIRTWTAMREDGGCSRNGHRCESNRTIPSITTALNECPSMRKDLFIVRLHRFRLLSYVAPNFSPK